MISADTSGQRWIAGIVKNTVLACCSHRDHGKAQRGYLSGEAVSSQREQAKEWAASAR